MIRETEMMTMDHEYNPCLAGVARRGGMDGQVQEEVQEEVLRQQGAVRQDGGSLLKSKDH